MPVFTTSAATSPSADWADRTCEAAFQRYNSGLRNEARQLCLRVLEALPAHGPSLYLLALIAINSADPQLALELVDESLRQLPDAFFCVLNDEFASVVAEIDRQSQAIGLNTGGTFAKSLSVFVGGGKGASDAAVLTNGSVTVDLSKATVDANSLGLKGVQAQGTADLSGKTAPTTVAAILTDATNMASTAQAGYTDFCAINDNLAAFKA